MALSNNELLRCQINAEDGSIDVPSISFANSPTIGLYLKASDQLAISYNSLDLFSVNSSNVVNLGNSVCVLQGSAAPTDAVTGANIAEAGSLYIRVAGASSNAYINCNTKASPTWKLITRAA